MVFPLSEWIFIFSADGLRLLIFGWKDVFLEGDFMELEVDGQWPIEEVFVNSIVVFVGGGFWFFKLYRT